MNFSSDGSDLRKILCLLETGMSLTAPDKWVDRIGTGTVAQRAKLIQKIAEDYHCIWFQRDGVQIFEKREVPFTG